MVTPASLFRKIAKPKYIAVFLWASVFTFVVAQVLPFPDEHEAQVTLRLQPVGLAADPRTENASGDSDIPRLSEAVIIREMELFRSRNALEEAVVRCGLVKEVERDPASYDNAIDVAIEQLDQQLKLKRVAKTNSFEVRYLNSAPPLATTVLSSLVELYLERTTLGKEVSRRRNELAKAQESVEKFRQQHNLTKVGSTMESLLQRKVEIEQRVADVEAQIKHAQASTSQVGPQPSRSPATAEGLPVTLIEKKAGRYEVPSLGADQGFSGQGVFDSSSDEGKRQPQNEPLNKITDQDLPPQSNYVDRRDVPILLKNLRAEREAAIEELRSTTAQLQDLQEVTQRYDELQHLVYSAERDYVISRNKLQQTTRNSDANQQVAFDVAVLRDQVAPVFPPEIKRGMLLTLNFLFATCLSLGFIFLTDRTHRRRTIQVNREDEVTELESLTKPIGSALSSVRSSAVIGSPNVRSSESEQPVDRPANAIWQVGQTKPRPVQERNGARSESSGCNVKSCETREPVLRCPYDRLMQLLVAFQPDKKGVSVGISHSVTAEVTLKTTYEMSNAIYRATGFPVLLIDASGQGLTALLGREGAPGLQELLASPEDDRVPCIHPTDADYLWFLPEGERQTYPNIGQRDIKTLRNVLRNTEVSLLVHLPPEVNGSVKAMLYSLLDAVVCSSDDVEKEGPALTKLTRSLMDSKKVFSEKSTTYVGTIDQWTNGDLLSLLVC